MFQGEQGTLTIHMKDFSLLLSYSMYDSLDDKIHGALVILGLSLPHASAPYLHYHHCGSANRRTFCQQNEDTYSQATRLEYNCRFQGYQSSPCVILQWILRIRGAKISLMRKVENPPTKTLRLFPPDLNSCTEILQVPTMQSGCYSTFLV